MGGEVTTAVRSVEAEFNYIASAAERPVVYLYRPPPGVAAQSGRYENRRMGVHDARPRTARLTSA